MSNVIKLKYVNKGIGVNFLDATEERHYNEIIEHIKPLVPQDVALGLADVEWDLDNMTLGHKHPKANRLLRTVILELAS